MTDHGAADTPHGEIGASIAAFLIKQLGAAADPQVRNVQRVPTGRSRENWLFETTWRTDGTTVTEALIVRRDPLGGLLETDRAVEFAVLQALARSPVPAPQPRWLDDSGAALGRPSLIMVQEPGTCDYYVLNGDRPLSDRVALAAKLCEMLAVVHAVDWRTLGMDRFLADPGPDAALAEVQHWETVLRRDQLEPYPELDLAAHWLRRHAPRCSRTVLVHGDFKAGNVLLDGDEPVALLDWELAHLGDLHEDLGWVTQPLRHREHLIAGHWDRSELLEHYARVTGSDVDERAVTWWNVLACYKTAVMQATGLRSYIEGRCDELYQPTAAVLATLADMTGFAR